jgi:hypothetical protein
MYDADKPVVICRIMERPLLHEIARLQTEKPIRRASFKSMILAHAPHLAWKAPTSV